MESVICLCLALLSESFIVYTTPSQIYLMDIAGGLASPIPFQVEASYDNFHAIDFDWKTSTLYISESGSRVQSDLKYLMHYSLKDMVGRFEKLASRSHPSAIAVDSESRLVYMADSGEGEIRVFSTDLYKSKVLIADLPYVTGMDVYPKEGLLFFGSSVPDGKLYRAHMDGTNIQAIVNSQIQHPSAISVDRQTGWVYWADLALKRIEKCQSDGSQRTTMAQLSADSQQPLSLTQDDSYIYFCLSDNQSILKMAKEGGGFQVVGPKPTVGNVIDLVAESPSLHIPGSNACSVGNGGCEQFCLPSPTGQICACDDIYMLSPNGKNCVESTFERAILLTDRDRSGIFLVDTDTGSFVRMELYNLNQPTGISWDWQANIFIWSSYTYKRIAMSCLYPQTCINAVASFRNDTHNLGHLEVDPSMSHVYMVDYLNNKIVRIPYSYQGVKETIINLGIATPRGLALHHEKRLLFWTEVAPLGKIRRANLDGSGITTVINSALLSPNALVIDRSTDELYWCDGGKQTIETSMLDGQTRRELYRGSNAIISITINRNYIYFSDLSTRSLHRIDRRTGQNYRDFGPEVFLHIFDMEFVDRGQPPSDIDPTLIPVSMEMPGPPSSTVTPEPEANVKWIIIISVCVVVGTVVLVIAIILICLCCRRRNNTKPKVSPKAATPLPSLPRVQGEAISKDNQNSYKLSDTGYQEIVSEDSIRNHKDPVVTLLKEQRKQNEEITRNLQVMQMNIMELQEKQTKKPGIGTAVCGVVDDGYLEVVNGYKKESSYEEIPDDYDYEKLHGTGRKRAIDEAVRPKVYQGLAR